MLHTVEIVSILLVALAMLPPLAHLLDFPGKSRTKDAYLTVLFTIRGSRWPVGSAKSVDSSPILQNSARATRHVSVPAANGSAGGHVWGATCLLELIYKNEVRDQLAIETRSCEAGATQVQPPTNPSRWCQLCEPARSFRARLGPPAMEGRHCPRRDPTPWK